MLEHLQPRRHPMHVLSTAMVWALAGVFTLLGALGITVAAIALAVVLGPFYATGMLAEWWRHRERSRGDA